MNSHKDHADVKIHPPILTLLFIAIAYVAKWSIPIAFVVPNVLRLIGFALVVIGFLCGVAAFMAFRKARTTLDPHGQVSVIVTAGIYRFTRNPIYLGFLLMLIGFPLNSGNFWGILLAPVFVMSMNSLVIEKEEAYLETKFKDVYTSYKSRVRRWL
jgi:protein-S-isoprenylcysteine O-methyltransferase Ste14